MTKRTSFIQKSRSRIRPYTKEHSSDSITQETMHRPTQPFTYQKPFQSQKTQNFAFQSRGGLAGINRSSSRGPESQNVCGMEAKSHMVLHQEYAGGHMSQGFRQQPLKQQKSQGNRSEKSNPFKSNVQQPGAKVSVWSQNERTSGIFKSHVNQIDFNQNDLEYLNCNLDLNIANEDSNSNQDVHMLSEINRQMSHVSGYTVNTDPTFLDNTPASQPVRMASEVVYSFPSKQKQSEQPFRQANDLNPRVDKQEVANKASNSALILDIGDQVQGMKGRKSPTFGYKPSERDYAPSLKNSSPGMASRKTMASSMFTGSNSEQSQKYRFNRGGKTSDQNHSNPRCSSFGRTTTNNLNKAGSSSSINDSRHKPSKAKSTVTLNPFGQPKRAVESDNETGQGLMARNLSKPAVMRSGVSQQSTGAATKKKRIQASRTASRAPSCFSQGSMNSSTSGKTISKKPKLRSKRVDPFIQAKQQIQVASDGQKQPTGNTFKINSEAYFQEVQRQGDQYRVTHRKKVSMSKHPQVPSHVDDEPDADQFLSDDRSSGPLNLFECGLEQQKENLEPKIMYSAANFVSQPTQSIPFHQPWTGFEITDSEDDDVLIPVVNPNKHVSNGEDGGRKRKLRHVSKIEHLKLRGKGRLEECCTNLFGTGNETKQHDDEQVQNEWSFPEIPEAKVEESPSPNQNQSMHSSSQNKKDQHSPTGQIDLIKAFDPIDADGDQIEFYEEQHESDEDINVPKSLGIEDSLFQETDEAQLLEKLDMADAFRPEMNPISPSTLAFLMREQNHPYIIIDCRWDYEYQAGHIQGAQNIDNPTQLEKQFFQDVDKIRRLMVERTILVFHCEFSQKRAPRLWQKLRELDRYLNLERYNLQGDQQLFYPEMYILNGGYSQFHKEYPECCEGGYLPEAAGGACGARTKQNRLENTEYDIKERIRMLKQRQRAASTSGTQDSMPSRDLLQPKRVKSEIGGGFGLRLRATRPRTGRDESPQ